MHTNVNDGKVFGGSVFQKINPDLETAINLGNYKENRNGKVLFSDIWALVGKPSEVYRYKYAISVYRMGS